MEILRLPFLIPLPFLPKAARAFEVVSSSPAPGPALPMAEFPGISVNSFPWDFDSQSWQLDWDFFPLSEQGTLSRKFLFGPSGIPIDAILHPGRPFLSDSSTEPMPIERGVKADGKVSSSSPASSSGKVDASNLHFLVIF